MYTQCLYKMVKNPKKIKNKNKNNNKSHNNNDKFEENKNSLRIKATAGAFKNFYVIHLYFFFFAIFYYFNRF